MKTRDGHSTDFITGAQCVFWDVKDQHRRYFVPRYYIRHRVWSSQILGRTSTAPILGRPPSFLSIAQLGMPSIVPCTLHACLHDSRIIIVTPTPTPTWAPAGQHQPTQQPSPAKPTQHPFLEASLVPPIRTIVCNPINYSMRHMSSKRLGPLRPSPTCNLPRDRQLRPRGESSPTV